LARRAKEGDKEAYRKLVESNLRFCYKHSKAVSGLWTSPFRVDRSRQLWAYGGSKEV